MAVANTLVISAVGTCSSTATFTAGMVVTGTSISGNTTVATNCTLSGGAGTCTLAGDAGTPGSETVTISAGVSATYNNSTSGKSINAVAFSGTSSTPFDSASTTATGSSTGALSIGPTGTLACPGSATNCEVLIGAVTINNSTAPTHDSNFTSLGFISSASFMLMEYKIVSAATAITWAPTLNGASGAWAAMLQGFEGTGAVAVTPKGTLLGVAP
jgi:hypothetical protein